MKRHQARSLLNGQVHRRDVAVPEENFGILAQQIVIDPVQQLTRSVAAADSKYGIDGWIGKHGMQIVDAFVNGAAQVAVSLAYVFAEPGFEVEIF